MKEYTVIGLMSGTSCDGLDIACCQFMQKGDKWTYEVQKAETSDYPESWKKRLQESTTLSGLDLAKLDVALGEWMGSQVNAFIHEHSLSPTLIASHGHTVFHQPEQRLTLQIGSPHAIYAATKIPVCANFRALDVALGGQGAPLVPIGDALLYDEYDICVNLGGIANLSYQENDQRIARDVAAANMVLNHLAQKLGNPYDAEGQMAKAGKEIPELTAKLENWEFYQKKGPKSLGYEEISSTLFPLFAEDSRVEDQLHTFSIHLAKRLGLEFQHCHKSLQKKVLISGGGALNSFLMQQIRENCGKDCRIVLPSQDTILFKEAIIFAFLGLLRVLNIPNCLSSVTGAKGNAISGDLIGVLAK